MKCENWAWINNDNIWNFLFDQSNITMYILNLCYCNFSDLHQSSHGVMSLESFVQCISLAQEFWLLPRTHKAKEDNLEVHIFLYSFPFYSSFYFNLFFMKKDISYFTWQLYLHFWVGSCILMRVIIFFPFGLLFCAQMNMLMTVWVKNITKLHIM